MKKISLILGLLCCVSALATIEFKVDCGNHCAFREFEKNCHGAYFKLTNGNSRPEFILANYDSGIDQCLALSYNPPAFRKVKLEEVQKLCDCSQLPPLPALPNKSAPMSSSTIEDLKELRALNETWAPCAPDPLIIATPADEQHPLKDSDLDSCQNMKREGKAGYVMLGCEELSSPDCTYHGNTNNYSGPLCFAGEADRCDDIKKSQDPVTGGWYRNAYQRRFPNSERGQSLFSRDEFLGVMLYLAKTKDKVAAEKWMRFIDKNPKIGSTVAKSIKVLSICPPRPSTKPPEVSDAEWKAMLPNDSCEFRGDTYGSMYRTYRHIGFSDKELKSFSKHIYRMMKISNPITNLTAELSTHFVPAVGYEQGNQASNLLLLFNIGWKNNKTLQRSASTINRRSSFESPYYHYLEYGPTEYGAHLIKKYCLRAPPVFGPFPDGWHLPSASYFDSSVHYFGGKTWEWLIHTPNGHECIGWINLYLKHVNLR